MMVDIPLNKDTEILTCIIYYKGKNRIIERNFCSVFIPCPVAKAGGGAKGGSTTLATKTAASLLVGC